MSYRFTNLSEPSAYTVSASTGCTYQSATQAKRNSQSITRGFTGREHTPGEWL